MTEFTPYAPPTPHSEAESISSAKGRRFSAHRLWKAYYIASGVAPILASATAFFLALYSDDSQYSRPPIGILCVPLILFTTGTFLSYLLMMLLGMPMIFYLNRRGRLTSMNLHLASLAACVLLAIAVCTYRIILGPQPAQSEIALVFGVSFLIFAPFTLVTATAFWFIACRERRADLASPP